MVGWNDSWTEIYGVEVFISEYNLRSSPVLSSIKLSRGSDKSSYTSKDCKSPQVDQ